jgi:hypothetical protein
VGKLHLYPDNPIHESASSATGRILGGIWNNEGSQSCQSWHTNLESEEFRSVYRISDLPGCDLWSMGAPHIRDADFENLSAMDSLTMIDTEPQSTIAPGISQFGDEALTEDSTSQFCFDHQSIDIHQPLLSSQWSTATSSDKNELYQNSFLNAASSSSSLEPLLSQSPSPLSSGQISEVSRKGKMKIPSIRKTYSCSTCRESFANDRLLRRHRHRHEHTAFLCEACQQSFTEERGLRRHQGKRGSISSCPVLKTTNPSPKRFACTCDKHSYTRQDTLKRHMDAKNSTESDQRHKCKACQHYPCRCQT